MQPLYIIDASGYLYRAYHAIHHLTNKKGESTNALYGFIRSLMKLCKDFNPQYLVAVFDGPRSTEKRKQLYPEYKAHRVSMPEDLRYQIKWAQDFCELFGIPILNLSGVEADDTIGSIAKWASKEQFHSYLCSSDKDLSQLVNDNISILNTHKENLILDMKGVEETFGVPPHQIIDFLAITGDASDNVPGITGFGPKTAVALLKQFGSMDAIFENINQISGKKQETLKTEEQTARLSKQLVTIDTDVEIPLEATFYAFTPSKGNEQLKQFYETMNFHTLIKEFEQENGKKAEESPTSYTLVNDEKSLDELINLLKTQKEICFDTETTGLKPMEAELVGIGFCFETAKAWYVPLNGALERNSVISRLKPLFENPEIGFYGHNVKYDWHILMNSGIEVANICFDTLLASYILNSHIRQHSLDALSLEYFQKVKISFEDLVGKGQKAILVKDVPLDQICTYCCEDVDYSARLKKFFEPELQVRHLTTLFFNLELPLLTVLAKMERNGIYLDPSRLKDLEDEVSQSLELLEGEIHELAGESFNIKSPKQLSSILFEKLKLPAPKKTATGLSTSAEVLESLQAIHPIAQKILDYRANEKLRSTYITALPLEINPKTGRIHPTFNQSVAATGRLSCQDPNLQNIPVRTPLGRKIREAFLPQKPGWSYLSADYSQIELRLLAHFSEDPSLIKAFENNEDIHTFTAATIFNIPLDQVTKEQRYRAKTVNFGIIYGQQAFGLSRELGISIEEASSFIKLYFERYPRIQAFLQSCKESAQKSAKAITLLGRERAIPEISNKNMLIRQAAERLAINTPLQGTGADLIKMAMLEIDKKLQKEQTLSYMILQIHDSLMLEVIDEEIPNITTLVKQEMEAVYKLKVPLTVEITIGKNWKEC